MSAEDKIEEMYQRAIDRCAEGWRNGDDYLLMSLIDLTVANDMRLPEDVRAAVRTAFSKYLRGESKTLDDAFDLNLSAIKRRKRQVKYLVRNKVDDERRRLSKSRLRGEDALENAAEQLNMSMAMVRRIYYDEET